MRIVAIVPQSWAYPSWSLPSTTPINSFMLVQYAYDLPFLISSNARPQPVNPIQIHIPSHCYPCSVFPSSEPEQFIKNFYKTSQTGRVMYEEHHSLNYSQIHYSESAITVSQVSLVYNLFFFSSALTDWQILVLSATFPQVWKVATSQQSFSNTCTENMWSLRFPKKPQSLF